MNQVSTLDGDPSKLLAEGRVELQYTTKTFQCRITNIDPEQEQGDPYLQLIYAGGSIFVGGRSLNLELDVCYRMSSFYEGCAWGDEDPVQNKRLVYDVGAGKCTVVDDAKPSALDAAAEGQLTWKGNARKSLSHSECK